MRPARFTRLSIDGAMFLRSLPPELARDVEASLEHQPFRVEGQWHGGTADVYLLRLGERRLVFKRRRPTRSLPLGHEGRVLERATREFPGERLFPPLLAAFGDEALMTEFVPGRHTRGAIRAWRLDGAELAARLQERLQFFHQRFDCALNDFSPSNVVVTHDGLVVLIDPTPQRAGDPANHATPLVADLALWTWATAIRLPWDIVRSPRVAWQMVRLNHALLTGSIGSGHGGIAASREVDALTNHYLARLRHAWRRDKPLWVLSRAFTWALMRWTNWSLRRSA